MRLFGEPPKSRMNQDYADVDNVDLKDGKRLFRIWKSRSQRADRCTPFLSIQCSLLGTNPLALNSKGFPEPAKFAPPIWAKRKMVCFCATHTHVGNGREVGMAHHLAGVHPDFPILGDRQGWLVSWSALSAGTCVACRATVP